GGGKSGDFLVAGSGCGATHDARAKIDQISSAVDHNGNSGAGAVRIKNGRARAENHYLRFSRRLGEDAGRGPKEEGQEDDSARTGDSRRQATRESHTDQNHAHLNSGSGVAASRVRVYSCCGWEVICSDEPISTISPRRITAMRSLRERTTGMEWEMKR